MSEISDHALARVPSGIAGLDTILVGGFLMRTVIVLGGQGML